MRDSMRLNDTRKLGIPLTLTIQAERKAFALL